MKTIYGKIIFGFILSIMISFSFTSYFLIQNNSEELSQFTEAELYDSLKLITKQIQNSNQETLTSVLTDIYESLNVNICLYYDDHQQYSIGNFNHNKKLDRAMHELYHQQISKVNVRDLHYQTIGSKINLENHHNVYLFIQKDIAKQDVLITKIVITTVLFIFIIGGMIFLVIADVIVKPIEKLTNATNELANGNYDTVVVTSGKDEISKLGQSFNYMIQCLEKTEQSRQQFISDVSHEFQTPLTSIQGFATILKEENLTQEQYQEYANIIINESERLSKLSKNMLQLTMMDQEDLLETSYYSLTTQLTRVIATLQESAKHKNILVMHDFPKKDIQICADENKLEQVWINVIGNAIKYTNPNGKVNIELTKNTKTVEVSIQDTGIGIAKENLPHIFKRFYREDKSRSIGGNGLGLSIVKRIVDLHHGNIRVNSTVQVGSTFTITLPIQSNKTNH